MDINVQKKYQDLVNFIIEETWLPKKPITNETIIGEDIRISGDDFVDFIDNYAEKFNVDVSNFHPIEYTTGEGCIDFIYLYRKFKGLPTYQIKKKLTVQRLLEGIITGKLEG